MKEEALLPYKQFFDKIWQEYCNEGLNFEDADLVLETATKLGLVREEVYNLEKHGEVNWEVEEGDPIYFANEIESNPAPIPDELNKVREKHKIAAQKANFKDCGCDYCNAFNSRNQEEGVSTHSWQYETSELREVREALGGLYRNNYACCPNCSPKNPIGLRIKDEAKQALATLDRLLGKDGNNAFR